VIPSVLFGAPASATWSPSATVGGDIFAATPLPSLIRIKVSARDMRTYAASTSDNAPAKPKAG
jgi:hypothetical protein